MAKGKKGKKASAPEVEVELDVEEEELEELDEDEPTEAAPKKKKAKKSAAQEVAFGASDLAALASQGRDKPITTRDLRTLLRKMARDGRLSREVVPGNRERYSWSGPDDPEVKLILKALKGGELEKGKAEALAKLKADQAAKRAAAAKAEEGKAKKGKAKLAVVEDDDDEDEDDDE